MLQPSPHNASLRMGAYSCVLCSIFMLGTSEVFDCIIIMYIPKVVSRLTIGVSNKFSQLTIGVSNKLLQQTVPFYCMCDLLVNT